jgi:CRISPR-associated protein Cas5d
MNEVGDVISGKTAIDKMKKGEFVGMIPSECRQQRTTRYLQDVHYVIEAHFTLTNEAEPNTTPAKVFNILRRRIRKGQCCRQPFFGSSEHVAHFREWEGDEIPAIQESRDFGLVSFGLDYSDPDNPKPQYFYCTMENGVIRVPHVSEVLM